MAKDEAETVAKKGASNLARREVRGVAKTETKLTAEAAAKAAPRGINTRTVAHTEAPVKSAFSRQAAAAVEAVPVKGVTKAVAYSGGAVAIGGGLYGLGTLTGHGLANVGYGIRDVTGNKTPEDVRKDQLDNYARQQALDKNSLDLMQKYSDWLKANQQSDSPTNRDIFSRYFMDPSRAGGTTQDNAQSSFGNTAKNVAIGAGILAVVGTGVYLAVRKKKGGRK